MNVMRNLPNKTGFWKQRIKNLNETNQNYMKMLGFITHELKSPLAAMQTMIDVMVMEMTEEISGEALTFLKRIKRNAEELQDMVKNYLDLSRVERGELIAQKSMVNVRREVIDPVVVQTSQLLRSRNINLEMNASSDIDIYADPELLRIALSNYLTNAAKYGKEGGNTWIDTSLTDGNLVVRVRNEGKGFTSEEKQQLFRKFSRLKNPLTIDKRGSGLGLYLCREIIELHGGVVDAESEPGVWAEFSFKIPQTQPVTQ